MSGDGRAKRYESARQRTLVLTFETPEQAADWDADGQPLAALTDVEHSVVGLGSTP